MRVPLSWLKEFVPLNMSVQELTELLNMGGLGVEEVQNESGDVVLVLEVTSNRGDCLSITGVAREVAALSGQQMTRSARVEFGSSAGNEITEQASVEIRDPELCARYVARLVEGVHVAPSPMWLQQRLISSGLRPINNIVDATNYVLLEMGQPLHAFDFATLRDGKIIVRRACEGERLITIDGEERRLAREMLVIADAERPVAIAGVMGGLETEVTEKTTTVLIESAHFNPLSIRRTRTALGMSTEASFRFERWVDPSGCLRAADRAAQLMVELAGGTVVPGAIDVYPRRIEPVRVVLRPGQVKRYLGIEIPPEEICAILRRLEFGVTQGNDFLTCEIPTFRNDITREADLIEEIARIHGYHRIPGTLPSGVSPRAGESEARQLERRAKSVLMRCGLQEVWTFGLISPTLGERARVTNAVSPMRLRNPLSEEYSALRTSLLPSLLDVLSRNAKVGNTDVHIFELGRVYLPAQGEEPLREKRMIGLAMVGVNTRGTWCVGKEFATADFYMLKGVIENLLGDLGVPSHSREYASEVSIGTFHPGRVASLQVDGREIGVLGEVHPEVGELFSLPPHACLAELDFEAIAMLACLERRFSRLPRFPSIQRDIAMILPRDLPSVSVEKVIRATGGELLADVVLFDVYTGKGIEQDKRSLAFSLQFRSLERTLTDEEVDARVALIKAALREQLGAVIREG
jgi:phenylalanyl-tRNA synthetase beta chain